MTYDNQNSTKENICKVKVTDNFYLVARENLDPDFPDISISVETKDNGCIQDVARVRFPSDITVQNDTNKAPTTKIKTLTNVIEVLIWQDPNSSDFTDIIPIDVYEEEK